MDTQPRTLDPASDPEAVRSLPLSPEPSHIHIPRPSRLAQLRVTFADAPSPSPLAPELALEQAA